MMKIKNNLLILIFALMIFFPKNIFAQSITGTAISVGPSGTLKGTVTCKASGKVLDVSKITKLNDGECVSGVRHGTSDYCCDSRHNAYADCKFWVVEEDCKCSKSRYTTPNECRNAKGTWRCDDASHWDEGTKSEWIPYYFVIVKAQGKNLCGNGTVTCKGDKGGSTLTMTFDTFRAWSSHSVTKRSANGLPSKGHGASSTSCNAYSGKWIDGIFIADTAYNRCCGGSSGPVGGDWTPDDATVMGCWRQKKSNVSGLSLYDKEDYYEYKWSHVGYCGDKKCTQNTFDDDGNPKTITYNCGSRRCNTTLGEGNWELYKIAGEDGMTEELCGRKKDPICQPTTPSELNESREADYCSQKDLEVPLPETTSCGANENEFYIINCKESVKASYDSVSFEKALVGGNYIDEKAAVVQPGTGFSYNVRFNHERSCEGSFNYDIFNKVFDNNVEIMRRADIFGDVYEYAWYYKILEAIDTISKTYEDQYTNIIENEKYLFNYDGTISFDYKVKDKSQSKQTEFVLNEEKENVYLEENNPIFKSTYNVRTKSTDPNAPVFENHKLKSGIYDRKLHNFVYTLHQESLLEPKRVYIDSKTANEAESGIDAGKKVFTDITTADGTYNILSQVNVYKKSSPSKVIVTITNDKCELKIAKDKVSYRIIEPTNPFVNSAREIPKNWSGPIGDFTKAINPGIGSTLIK